MSVLSESVRVRKALHVIGLGDKGTSRKIGKAFAGPGPSSSSPNTLDQSDGLHVGVITSVGQHPIKKSFLTKSD